MNVLITGASSGLGAALARACSAPGVVLHLGGRDAARLESVAASCRAHSAEARPHTVDVRDAAAMAAWIEAAGKLDLVIANAGISTIANEESLEPEEQVRATFATNIDGVVNTVFPAIRTMSTQAPDSRGIRGHIAVIASIAAFAPLPNAPSYCAAKAAIDAWTVASAPRARREGIVLTSVCPGFIRTPMTEKNRFPMPGLMDADRAAAIALRGIGEERTRFAFPLSLAALSRFGGLLPPRFLASQLKRNLGRSS